MRQSRRWRTTSCHRRASQRTRSRARRRRLTRRARRRGPRRRPRRRRHRSRRRSGRRAVARSRAEPSVNIYRGTRHALAPLVRDVGAISSRAAARFVLFRRCQLGRLHLGGAPHRRPARRRSLLEALRLVPRRGRHHAGLAVEAPAGLGLGAGEFLLGAPAWTSTGESHVIDSRR